MRQIDVLRYAVDRLEELKVPYAVVGSYASGAWGEPRMTRDIDIAPEDVILGKLIYLRDGGSEKHVRDITGIVKIQRENLDFAYLSRMTAEMHISETWRSIIERL